MTGDEILHELMLCDGYVVNQLQMERFKRILDFFVDITAEGVNRIESVELLPYKRDGVITASLTAFDVRQEEIERLCEISTGIASIAIEVTEDCAVQITATVADVFVLKD
ncbi:MAG: hypothetical protein LUH18_07380 [Oscillospiraceae bacterium]|nr:hypothetical protein [Oscillospiraceae bacterium]